MKRPRISDTKRQIVFARDRWTCVYCLRKPTEWEVLLRDSRPYVIGKDESGNWFEIDHVVAVALGGTNSLDNLCVSCWGCNSSKRDRRYQIPKNFPRIKLEGKI